LKVPSASNNRKIAVALGAVLVASLALNAVLLVGITPVLRDYAWYRDARGWVSRNILRRDKPDESVIYQTSAYTLAPMARRAPAYTLSGLLREGYDAAQMRQDAWRAMRLGRIERGPFDLEVGAVEEGDGFQRIRISYGTQAGVRVPAYLLQPATAPPWPAVLVVHGCGYGKAGPAGLIKDLHRGIGVELAKAGFLVLVPDRRGFGELQPVPHYITPDCTGGSRDGRVMLNRDALARYRVDLRSLDVFDLLVAVEYLASREDVKGIGIAGLSGGGTVAEYVAGMSDDIEAVVLSNSVALPRELYPYVFEGVVVETTSPAFGGLPKTPLEWSSSARSGVPSALSSIMDNIQLIPLAMLPPKSVLLQYGDSDKVNYLRGGEGAIELVKAIYEARGLGDLVEISIEPGEHEFFPEAVAAFFRRRLGTEEVGLTEP
jgi:pimeloyl-ACP methyl ester carboxylesterase